MNTDSARIIQKTPFSLFTTRLSASQKRSQRKKGVGMASFVLVHGGCHGGWCWEQVVPLLEAQGHHVLTPDLPGAGKDTTPIRDVTLADRVTFISDLIMRQSEQVILVGHSMGGTVISGVAEMLSHRIAAVVYLAAFMLKNGESMWESAVRVAAPTPELITADDGKVNLISAPSIREFFYNTTPPSVVDNILPRLTEESILIGATPVHVTAGGFGQVPRYYIETGDDRAIVPELQRLMQQDWPCRKVFEIDTDHSPFYSAPETLAAYFQAIAEDIK